MSTPPPDAGSAAPTLLDLVERTLRGNGPRTALVGPRGRLTYAELDRASARAAGDLQAAGVRPGDHVALLMANGLEYPVYDLAIVRAGAVKVPLNDMLAVDDVGQILRHCDARVLVVGATLAERAAQALAAHPGPTATLAARPVEVLCEEGEPTGWTPVPRAADDGAAVFFTGGTSGRPKAVMHSQGGMAANMLSTVLEAQVGRDERLLLTTPLPHAAGLFTLASILRGATAVIAPGFDAGEVLAAFEEHRITWTFMVPTMIYRVLDHPDVAARDHSSLRTIQYGAAPIDPERLAQAVATFGPVLIQLYGQTEVPNFATTLTKEDHVRAMDRPDLLLSCGRAVMMADVSVRDDDGAELPAGEIGEVCVRAPYTMVGYLGDPEAAAERFVDGWLRTGDIAAQDEEGYLYLKDRRSDMVISGGMNVYTAVVERVVVEAPGVGQAAVIGIPDADWGESVHAVVTAAGGAVDEAAVLAHCRERLASYMRPKTVEVVAEMPLTPYGKIDKKRLRAARWSGRERQIS